MPGNRKFQVTCSGNPECPDVRCVCVYTCTDVFVLFPFKLLLLSFANCLCSTHHNQRGGSEIMDEAERVWRGEFSRSNLGFCLMR
jgi:hypothetical protein